MNTTLDQLELSTRTQNCLEERFGVDFTKITMDMVCALTEAEILKTRNFGRRSLNEIKEVFAHYGRALGDGRSEAAPAVEPHSEPPLHPLHAAISVLAATADMKRRKLIDALQQRYNNFNVLRLALDELEQYERAVELMRRNVK